MMIRNFVSGSKRAKKIQNKLAKARQEEKPFIYASEELIRWRNIRYDLFLEVGNMADIQAMTPKDLMGIAERSHERKPPEKGKLKMTRKTKYDEEVIRRGREERAKARRLEKNKQKEATKKWQDM